MERVQWSTRVCLSCLRYEKSQDAKNGVTFTSADIQFMYTNINNISVWYRKFDYNYNPSLTYTGPKCIDGYISGIRVKSKNCKASTNNQVGLCGVEIECSQFNGASLSYITVINSDSGEWGSWIKSKDKFICGSQERKDGSVVSGLKVMFCSIATSLSYNIKDYTKNYTVDRSKPYTEIEAGDWGNWQAPFEAPQGYLGCAVAIVGFKNTNKKDDAGAVQIVLVYCGILDWFDKYFVNLNQHTLKDDEIYRVGESCPTYTYITGVSVKYQERQGNGDDSALNAIEIRCSTLDGNVQNEPKWINNNPGIGKWKPRVEFDGRFVCGAQVRYEEWVQGQDNTAVNGLRIHSCQVKR
jgi:hypothetical protein